MVEPVVKPDPNEGIAVPGEVPPVETKARNMGWRPKEEWDGDPDTWIDAKEFVGRQPLFDKIAEIKSENWNLKKDLNQFAEYHKRMAEVEYQRALTTLKAERKQAVNDGDAEKVVEISEKIENLALTPAPPAPQHGDPGITPEFSRWLGDNPWYQADVELRSSADALGTGFKAANPNANAQQVLDHVSGKMKELYPTKFGGKTRRGTASVEGGGPGPIQASGKFTEADLNEFERDAMNTFVIKRKLMTRDQYLSELAKAKGRA